MSYLFFSRVHFMFLLVPVLWIYVKNEKSILVINRKKEICKQFCDTLESLEAYLRSGTSIEMAFEKVVVDIELLYGKRSYVLKEIKKINASVKLDISIEEALKDFANRVDIREISIFSELFEISKRRDGNIINVIESMCSYIKEKEELNREIRNSINAVISELAIMKLMPFAILIYLRLFSKGYFEDVYESFKGCIIMFVILVVYFITLYVIKKMENGFQNIE